MKRKVLDVGQCNADNYRINELLQKHFDAQVDRSHSLDEAIEAAANTAYDLILINRLLDADGSAGMDVLTSLKSNPASADIPVMIVSNYQDAQDQAVQRCGGRFWKSRLGFGRYAGKIGRVPG